MWAGFLSGQAATGTPRPPFGKLTRLTVDGYGGKRAGSFSTKFQGAHEPGTITRLSVDGYGAKRAGSFAGRDDQSFGAAIGTSTVAAESDSIFQGVGSSAGIATVVGISDSPADLVGTSTGTSTATGVGSASSHPVGRITRLSLDGYQAKRAGSFANKSGAVGIGTAAGVGTASAIGRSIWQAVGRCDTHESVGFDGVDDGLRRSTALAGVADNAVALSFAMCMGFRGGFGNLRGLLQDGTASIWFYRTTTGELEFIVSDGVGASLTVTSSITIPDDTVMHSILFSCRTDFSAGNKLYSLVIDRVEDPSPTVVDASASFNVDWATITNDLTIMRQLQGPLSFTQGDVAYVWMAIGDSTKFIDFGTPANVDTFIDSTSKFRQLGGRGELPLGVPAEIYLRGPSTSIRTNLGTGGDFAGTVMSGGLDDGFDDGFFVDGSPIANPLSEGPQGIALGISAITGVGVGTATGTGTATGASDTSAGVGTSAGTSAVSGFSDTPTTGTAAGTSDAAAAALADAETVGSTAGISAVAGIGVGVSIIVGSAAGSATASGVGASSSDAVGEAFGNSVAQAVGFGDGVGVGTAFGASNVLGDLRGADAGAGTAEGIATVDGVGASDVTIIGSAAGTSEALAVGRAAGWIPTTEGTDTWTEVSATTDIWTEVTESTNPWTEKIN